MKIELSDEDFGTIFWELPEALSKKVESLHEGHQALLLRSVESHLMTHMLMYATVLALDLPQRSDAIQKISAASMELIMSLSHEFLAKR